METGYCQVRQKEVVNICDGKKLGRVCDVVFTFPEGKVEGFVVPGGRGFFRPEVFVELKKVVKIGEDTILVEMRTMPKSSLPKHGHGYAEREENPPRPRREGREGCSFEEEE
jgi:YlmC/YmxH family sporulation protein